MAFYVYILRCNDTSYYTGHTDNLETRLAQHHTRAFPDCYTANRLPVELVYQQVFGTREEALASERRIKGWSRKKKEAMMCGNWQEVARLARAKSTTIAGSLDPVASAHPEHPSPVHPEPQKPSHPEQPNPVQPEQSNPVHPEPVEGCKLHTNPKPRANHPSTLRQAQSSG